MQENSNTKKVSISLVGSSGKMGTTIQELAKEDIEIEIVEKGDVVIDFSSLEGTKRAIQMNRPLVCGTTGLSEEVFLMLEALSKKVPVVYAPNFSIGIALMSRMLKCAQGLKNISITETHHIHKKDSPSGTAIQLAEILGVKTNEIASVRKDEVVGMHEVQFLFEDEKLSLTHEAFSRKAFAKGALLAAKWLFNKKANLYSFEEILVDMLGSFQI